MYQIEKDIPLPRRSRNNGLKYPFNRMEVGDSFQCGCSVREAQRVRSALAYYFKSSHVTKGQKFTIRHLGGDIYGCWRTK